MKGSDMVGELFARFFPAFLRGSHERLQRAREHAARFDAASARALASEMHSMAGEAALLGIEQVVKLSRSIEQIGRAGAATSEEAGAAREKLTALLGALETVLNSIASGRQTNLP